MRKILVVTDPEFSNEVVLNRIKEVPKEDTLFRIEHYLAATSAKDGSAFSTALQEKQKWLDDLVAPLIADGFKIEIRVQAYAKLHEAIIASALDFGADYVFKPLRHHSNLHRVLYTSTDWNLIRFCPCPLLLVSANEAVHGKAVLATLDLETRDAPHQKLNEIVLERSKALAGLVEGQVHIASAYNTITVASGNTSLDPLQYNVLKGARDEHLKKGKAIAESNEIEPDNVHLGEGAPEIVVNEIANSIDAGIIVLGTVARTGVSGMFIGNTAESVMESVNVDVFVVKQREFVTPIK